MLAQYLSMVSDLGFMRRRLTDNEKRLDDVVADHGRPARVDKADIVGHYDGDEKSGDEHEPVPAGLEDTVVRQNEPGFLDGRRLVFGQRNVCGLQQCLQIINE